LTGEQLMLVKRLPGTQNFVGHLQL